MDDPYMFFLLFYGDSLCLPCLLNPWYLLILNFDKKWQYLNDRYVYPSWSQSEEHELFSNIADNVVGDDFQNVEVHSFAESFALPDDDDITFLNAEGGRAVDWNISVPLFVSVVLGNIMKVISADDDSPLHFGGDDDALQNFASDWHVGGEWALLIDVGGFDCLFWCSEAEADVFEIAYTWRGFLG